MPIDAKKLVKKASQLMKPVEKFQCESPRNTTTEGETITFDYAWATHLNDDDFEWVFALFKKNMMEMYQKSQWGYDENSKRNELRATTSRFIIAVNSKGEKIGYLTYRFVVDHNIPVTYCWELQISPSYQNKGVGGMMLNTLERLSEKAGMSKVMATVFLYNSPSLGFFHKNGFSEDVTCPSEDSGLDYAILSKATP
uniref:N-alpha-acetyltransferase 40 n=1 Tax=Caenorhabditis japonica TaxID=281687 RepID=A0A8R1HH82_CAEJA